MTFTGPILKDLAAFTQSFEYRFLRTPVNSLPPLQRDTKLEGFNSYTQFDFTHGANQTATVSVTIYPQKLDYIGLNTFTPQPSTTDFRQRGYEVYGQHRYMTGDDSVLISQFSYKTYDIDINAQSNDPYELMIDTTAGGFFNRQSRRTARYDALESYQFAPRQLVGTHQIKAGVEYSHSSLSGLETSLPVKLIGSSGTMIEQITFTPASSFNVGQSETAAFVSDQWAPLRRLSFGLGLRLDNDTVTGSTHVAPRGSMLLTLTGDGKTLLSGGAGIFYDRVPLMLPTFPDLPERAVSMYDPTPDVQLDRLCQPYRGPVAESAQPIMEC
jgi:outer membrane receptor for ferrienterochelin and colicin